MNKETQYLSNLISELCLIQGLSGYEDEVRHLIQGKLKKLN